MAKGTLESVSNWMQAQVGTKESPSGSNRTIYGRHYGMDGYAWCAMFLWDGLTHHNDIDHVKSAYTPAVAEWYRQKGRFFTDPGEVEKGDLVFFDFPDSLNRIQHIGWVTGKQRRDGLIPTIEGNTSSGNAGSQDNGGGVFRRLRPTRDIVGFAKPLYKKPPRKPQTTFPKGERSYLRRGDKGADVRNLQRHLNWYFANKSNKKSRGLRVEVTGTFDNKTLKLLKQFQHERKLDVDGRAGQHTLKKLEKIKERG